MDTNEEFIFGDLSDLDLKNCEEISINSTTIEQPKKILHNATPIKEAGATPYKTPLVKDFSVNLSSKDPNSILTVKQAAQYLQLRTETILRKIYAGELGAFKVGRIWRIKQAQIEDYLNRNISDIKEQ
ncbi:MAG: helix-turn-helix domain-containing protein [Clostridiaceae bacterium]|nr:helix-turn-helix domain-containing protein [Clostridiaceae bacterium]